MSISLLASFNLHRFWYCSGLDGRHGPEMTVKRRFAHADLRREIIDAERPGEVSLQPIDRLSDPLAPASDGRHLS